MKQLMKKTMAPVLVVMFAGYNQTWKLEDIVEVQ
jgi:hypothetical protein